MCACVFVCVAIWSGNVCATGGNVGISLALDSWLSYHALLFLALFMFSSLFIHADVQIHGRRRHTREKERVRKKNTEAGEDGRRDGRIEVGAYPFTPCTFASRGYVLSGESAEIMDQWDGKGYHTSKAPGTLHVILWMCWLN